MTEASTYAARLAQLARATGELAAARDAATVTEIVVTHVADAVAATVATVSLLVDDHTLALSAIRGGHEQTVDRWSRYPLGERTPAGAALRTGLPVELVGRSAILEEYPALAEQVPDERSVVCLPLQVAERGLGVIGLVFAGRHRLDERELEFLTILADTCAQSLDRVRALEDSRAAAARLSFLAEASAELATSLDYRVTLANVARLAVPTLADLVAVSIVEDGRLHTLEVAHVDPAKVELARRLQERYPADPDAPAGVASVVRTGVSELHPQITDEMMVAGAVDAEHLAMTRALQLHSAMIAPLITVDQRTLGAITFVQAESGRRYGPEDLALAEALARRAAVAIDNSELHSQTRDAAELLQHAVLPDRLASVPGWDVAALYRPAGRTEVGGDFYDTLALGPRTIAVVVGDVSGRGVNAAAAMAHVRSAVRAYAAVDPTPVGVLSKLQRMFRVYDIGRLVTLLYLVADADTGQAELVSAGHPPPLRLDPDGTCSLLDVVPAPPLGAGLFVPQPARTTMAPGQLLLLYSDGLVERREEAIDEGLARLQRHAGVLLADPLAVSLADLADRMHDPARDDDVTALALRRWPAQPSHERRGGAVTEGP